MICPENMIWDSLLLKAIRAEIPVDDVCDEGYEAADINRDGYVNERDYELLLGIIDNTELEMRNYWTTYNLGYIDPQTEALLEQEYNAYENISEVSK